MFHRHSLLLWPLRRVTFGNKKEGEENNCFISGEKTFHFEDFISVDLLHLKLHISRPAISHITLSDNITYHISLITLSDNITYHLSHITYHFKLWYHISHINYHTITFYILTRKWGGLVQVVSVQKGFVWDVLKMDQFKLKGMIGASKRFAPYFVLCCSDIHESFETWNMVPSLLPASQLLWYLVFNVPSFFHFAAGR